MWQDQPAVVYYHCPPADSGFDPAIDNLLFLMHTRVRPLTQSLPSHTATHPLFGTITIQRQIATALAVLFSVMAVVNLNARPSRSLRLPPNYARESSLKQSHVLKATSNGSCAPRELP